MEKSLKVEFQILYRLWGIKHASRCPCCGGYLKDKNHVSPTRRGLFMGCLAYPNCKGARFADGKPVFNEFTRQFFLAKQAERKKLDIANQPKPIPKGRFVDIE